METISLKDENIHAQTWDIIQEAQKNIKKEYDKFSALILWGKNEAFCVLSAIRELEETDSGIGIPLEPIKGVDDFITKDMREHLIKEYLSNPWDFEKLDFIYKIWTPTQEEQYMFFKAYCLRIADPNFENHRKIIAKFIERFEYVLTREKAWDLFVAIAEKTESAYWTVYELSHIFERHFWYIIITKEVAETLISSRHKLHRNGKLISYEALKNIIEQEKTLYFYGQHSYYGTLYLGNEVVEK